MASTIYGTGGMAGYNNPTWTRDGSLIVNAAHVPAQALFQSLVSGPPVPRYSQISSVVLRALGLSSLGLTTLSVGLKTALLLADAIDTSPFGYPPLFAVAQDVAFNDNGEIQSINLDPTSFTALLGSENYDPNLHYLGLQISGPLATQLSADPGSTDLSLELTYPATGPLGSLSLAEEHLRMHLADTPSVRSFLGVSTQAAALARIYQEAAPPPADGDQYTLAELALLRPMCIVGTSPNGGHYSRHESTSDARNYTRGGKLFFRFEEAVDPAIKNNHSEVMRRFKNKIGVIKDEMEDLAGKSGYLGFDDATIDDGPSRSHPHEWPAHGDYCWADLSVEWSGI